jgi:flagellar hook-associated protein 3 FlgL
MSNTGISFLGQSNAQISRLKQQNLSLADLQRQLASQKKYEDISGFGLGAGNAQRTRFDKDRLNSYLGNVTSSTNRLKLLNTTMTEASSLARKMINAIQLQVREGNVDTNAIKTLGDQSLSFLQDLMNTNIEGRYLFAGSNTDQAPSTSLSTLKNNVQTDYTDWLNGTQTTAQFLATIDGASLSYMGMNNALTTAGKVTMRVNTSVELDYTSLADQNGMKDLMLALSLATELKQPGSGDIPSRTEFYQVLDKISDLAQSAVEKLDAGNGEASTKFALVANLRDSHERDIGVLEQLIAEKENPDINDIVVKIQSLQTQLQASYQITGALKELSLINFI